MRTRTRVYLFGPPRISAIRPSRSCVYKDDSVKEYASCSEQQFKRIIQKFKWQSCGMMRLRLRLLCVQGFKNNMGRCCRIRYIVYCEYFLSYFRTVFEFNADMKAHRNKKRGYFLHIWPKIDWKYSKITFTGEKAVFIGSQVQALSCSNSESYPHSS